MTNKKHKNKKTCHINADLYLSSIKFAAETTPHPQTNGISHVKRHHVMNLSVDGKLYRVDRDSFLTARVGFL